MGTGRGPRLGHPALLRGLVKRRCAQELLFLKTESELTSNTLGTEIFATLMTRGILFLTREGLWTK